MTEAQPSKDSASQRFSFNSDAEVESGMPFGPPIPALLTTWRLARYLRQLRRREEYSGG